MLQGLNLAHGHGLHPVLPCAALLITTHAPRFCFLHTGRSTASASYTCSALLLTTHGSLYFLRRARFPTASASAPHCLVRNARRSTFPKCALLLVPTCCATASTSNTLAALLAPSFRARRATACDVPRPLRYYSNLLHKHHASSSDIPRPPSAFAPLYCC